MSVRTMAKVWEFSRRSGTELLMLLAIADFADDYGNAYPSVTKLAEKCRMTPRNANMILANLKKSGELSIKLNNGPKGTNRYLIQFRPPEECFVPEVHFALKLPSATPEAGFPKPLKPNSDEPSVNHQESSKQHDAKNKRHVCSLSASESVEEGFATFWALYPKKIAKPQALKAWKMVKPAGQVLVSLLAGLEKQKGSPDWQKNGGQFIPHPATWLNGRRWEDEGPPAAKETQAPTLNPVFDGAI